MCLVDVICCPEKGTICPDQEGGRLMIKQTVIQVHALLEGAEANNEVIYWFIALFF